MALSRFEMNMMARVGRRSAANLYEMTVLLYEPARLATRAEQGTLRKQLHECLDQLLNEAWGI